MLFWLAYVLIIYSMFNVLGSTLLHLIRSICLLTDFSLFAWFLYYIDTPNILHGYVSSTSIPKDFNSHSMTEKDSIRWINTTYRSELNPHKSRMTSKSIKRKWILVFLTFGGKVTIKWWHHQMRRVFCFIQTQQGFLDNFMDWIWDYIFAPKATMVFCW